MCTAKHYWLRIIITVERRKNDRAIKKKLLLQHIQIHCHCQWQFAFVQVQKQCEYMPKLHARHLIQWKHIYEMINTSQPGRSLCKFHQFNGFGVAQKRMNDSIFFSRPANPVNVRCDISCSISLSIAIYFDGLRKLLCYYNEFERREKKKSTTNC